MKVQTLWVWQDGDDLPELLVAVDELTMQANERLWDEKRDEALAIYGQDREYRIIDLDVSYDAIVAAFQPATVTATVTGPEPTG